MIKQAQANLWLNIIYPENEDVNINSVYLKNHTKDEILECFSHFRSYMVSIFIKIAEGNIDFPSTLHCIFSVILIMAQSGKLKGDTLWIDKKAFKDSLKKVQSSSKKAVVDLLQENGFVFESDIFSSKNESCSVEFPDDNLVLKGMYLYSMACTFIEINSGMYICGRTGLAYELLNPKLFENTKENEITFILDDFLRFFDGEEEKEAIRIFHTKMIEHGYKFSFKVDIFGGDSGRSDNAYANIGYTVKDCPTAHITVRIDDDYKNRKPSIGIKISGMRTITRKYSDYIEKCSDEFKCGLNKIYPDCSESCCEQTYMEQCKYCMEYSLNDIHYCKCTCLCWGCIEDKRVFTANKNDIDTYLYFVRENDTKKKISK